MEFEVNNVSTFLHNFETVKTSIRQFSGCMHLELLKDKNDPTIFFTYSHWEHEDDLENYRNSDLFKSVWATTKPLFRSKAQAWSVDSIHRLT